MSCYLAVPFSFTVHGLDGSLNMPNGNSKTEVEAFADREHKAMPRQIDEISVRPTRLRSCQLQQCHEVLRDRR